MSCGYSSGPGQLDHPSPAQGQAAFSVDIFDPEPSVVERITFRHRDALLGLLKDHSRNQIDNVVKEIRNDDLYQYVESALVTYYNPHAEYLTIDIVTRQDTTQRMPFRAAPSGSYTDPDGVISAWYTYQDKVFELLDQGEHLHATQCPLLHCLADPRHPKLLDLAARLEPARQHLAELAMILRDDADVTHRAAAAYLMAYATDGQSVVTALESAMTDPSALVRNNAMRVLAEIAHFHPEVSIPIEPVLSALDYPATTDRNKAAAILGYLLEHPNNRLSRGLIVRAAARPLLAMLKLQQPNNHDLAYKILKSVSGQSFSERNYQAWQAWIARSLNTTAGHSDAPLQHSGNSRSNQSR